jgi:type I restriction enzyme, S subunit
MSDDWPMVHLGNLLQRIKDEMDVEDFVTYQRLTIHLNNKGISIRDEVPGREIGTKRQFVVHEGQFLLSKIDARNGAFGIVPHGVDSGIITGNFWAYDVDDSRLHLPYFNYLTHTPLFQDFCVRASSGTTNRRYLQEDLFLGQEMSLPPLDEQRRLVARIEALAAKIEEARGLRRLAVEEAKALTDSIAKEMLNCEGETTVGDFVTVQSGYAFKSEWFTDEGIRLVRNVNIGHGKIEWDQIACILESRRSEFDRFELAEGDILVSLDRPIISTGVKVARMRPNDLPSLLLQRVGRVCFLSDKVLPEFLFAWLRSPNFINSIDPGRSNGVPHISQRDIERIAFAPPVIPEQRRIVAYLDGLQGKVDALKQLQSQTQMELDALLPSVLDKAFGGEL